MVARRIVIKVCQLREREDLDAAKGADLVGALIEPDGGPGSLDWDEATELFSLAKGEFLSVAVLKDPSAAMVSRAFKEAMADMAQVVGRLPEGLHNEDRKRIIPSVEVKASLRASEATSDLAKVSSDGRYPFVHLRATSERGTSWPEVAPAWSVCAHIISTNPYTRFLVGGALTPLNVVMAIRSTSPAGVDYACGGEEGPKARAKLTSFIKVIRTWEAKHT